MGGGYWFEGEGMRVESVGLGFESPGCGDTSFMGMGFLVRIGFRGVGLGFRV